MRNNTFKLSDDGFFNLLGAIIYDALDDALKPIPKREKYMTSYMKSKREQIIHDKNSALHFFKSSQLFKDTKLDFKFLVKKYREKNNGKVIDEKVANGILRYYRGN